MTNNIYFIANWKMYGSTSSLNSLNRLINLNKLKKYNKAKIIYFPPFTLIRDFIKKFSKTKISVGGQNCHQVEDYGFFTGSISPKMLKDLGCKFVILGHSENRTSGESDHVINKKIRSALNKNLKIVFCIGETLKEKRKKLTHSVLKKQINRGLKGVKNCQNILIAYEPVWSIGTGIIPKDKELEMNVNKISKLISKRTRFKLPILYGGSVNNKNISSLKNIIGISGFLVGSASQSSKKFIDIIKKTIN
jgi:triosephosphate isomerase|tara:strand:- start:382 stop:1128 length:747 start_codon:yes stop_codon:yes gene_type:complete